jgi:hypothetical protein
MHQHAFVGSIASLRLSVGGGGLQSLAPRVHHFAFCIRVQHGHCLLGKEAQQLITRDVELGEASRTRGCPYAHQLADLLAV